MLSTHQLGMYLNGSLLSMLRYQEVLMLLTVPLMEQTGSSLMSRTSSK